MGCQDRKKFHELVTEVKDLIDGLQDITKTISTAVRQDGTFIHRVQQVKDVDTLHLVSSVCEIDHPSIFDTASVKLEVMSMASTRRGEIQKLMNEIDVSDHISSDLESMTITELKHTVLQLMEDKRCMRFKQFLDDTAVQTKGKIAARAAALPTISYPRHNGPSYFFPISYDQINGGTNKPRTPVATKTDPVPLECSYDPFPSFDNASITLDPIFDFVSIPPFHTDYSSRMSPLWQPRLFSCDSDVTDLVTQGKSNHIFPAKVRPNSST